MINLLEEEREVTLEKKPFPPSKILDLEKRQATEQAEEKNLAILSKKKFKTSQRKED
jgi:hypothetical protein